MQFTGNKGHNRRDQTSTVSDALRRECFARARQGGGPPPRQCLR
jgi:hypothetical protein